MGRGIAVRRGGVGFFWEGAAARAKARREVGDCERVGAATARQNRVAGDAQSALSSAAPARRRQTALSRDKRGDSAGRYGGR